MVNQELNMVTNIKSILKELMDKNKIETLYGLLTLFKMKNL